MTSVGDHEIFGPTWDAFPLDARLAWMELSPDSQEAILSAAWCVECRKSTPFTVVGGRLAERGLMLNGRCNVCGGEIGRFVER